MSVSANGPVLATVRAPLRAIGEIVLPGSDALDEAGWRRVESIVEGALARRPPRTWRQLRAFLRVLNLLSLPLTGRTMVKLPLARRECFLKGVERSPLSLLRRGLWGVRTLLLMGYYNQESVRRAIGYRARPEGWTALRGRGSPHHDDAGGETEPGEAEGPRRRQADRNPEISGSAGEGGS